MKRTLQIGFTFGVFMAMSGLAAMAYVDTEYTPRVPNGPLHQGRVMVKRRDLDSNPGKPVPGIPDKPHPILDARAASGGGKLSGYRASAGGGVAMATQSPQAVLETRLKSLANDLR